jgi:hypothetical protein
MLLGFEQMKLSGFEPNPDLKWERIGDVPAPERLMMASKATSAGLMVFACYSRCYRQTSHPTH